MIRRPRIASSLVCRARGLLALFVAIVGLRASPAVAFRLTTVGGAPVRGLIIEGSGRQGGIQPDYLVDEVDDPQLRRILARAARLGQQHHDYWTTVHEVSRLVQRSLSRRGSGRATDYNDPAYRALVASYRRAGVSIPIGQYARQHLGVCREHYIVTHLALLRAGIDNEAVYASIQGGPRSNGAGLHEGHGFVVLRGGAGEGRTVDTYYAPFDGQDFARLQSVAGAGTRASGPLRVLAVREHPNRYPATGLAARRFGIRAVRALNGVRSLGASRAFGSLRSIASFARRR